MSVTRKRGRSRARSATITAAAGVLAVGLVSVFPASAHTGSLDDPTIFELDANTSDPPTPAGDDWDTIYDTEPLVDNDNDEDTPSANDQTDHSAFATSGIVADPAPLSIFTQGGSKDYLDIPNWAHKNGSVPDKNDITNAYAAAYAEGGDTIIYFGMDRFATEGSANVGFWFLQDPQFAAVAGSPAGSTSGFTGEHAVPIDLDEDGNMDVPGDILVLSEFDEGGDNPSVKVFEWVGSGGDEGGGALNTIFGGTDGTVADCSDNDHPAEVCAIVNKAVADGGPGALTPAWRYEGKKVQGKATLTIPVAAFFEGGINLTEMFGTTPCISSFVAETRSSFETNAILKDLAVGDFDLCGSLKWLKVDAAGAALAGATFEVCRVVGLADATNPGDLDVDECWSVEDNYTDGDDATTASVVERNDEDAADGVFRLNALQPGLYTIVETDAPDGYQLDPDVKQVTVVQGSVVSEPMWDDDDDPNTPDVPDPFVDLGLYKVIVLTCDTSTETLVASTVTMPAGDEETETVTRTTTPALPDGVSEAELCGLGGASYDDLDDGTYDLRAVIPSPAP